MRLALALGAALLVTACGSPAAVPAAAPYAPAAGASRAACARFHALADHADATGSSEADMRRALAAMAAIPAPPHLAALFREFAADGVAILNGAKGTIPGLGDVIRELNADCPRGP